MEPADIGTFIRVFLDRENAHHLKVRQMTVLESQSQAGEINQHGNTVLRSFHLHQDRHYYDTIRCSKEEGWHKYPTDQDAWYFGVWFNPELKQIMTYAEGDEILSVCTDDGWYKEMAAMDEFYRYAH